MKFISAIAIPIVCVSSALAASQPSVTARASSSFTISTIQLAAKNSPSERMDSRCVLAIPKTALESEFQTLLESHLTAEEISHLDAFYSSSLGDKYQIDALQQIESSKYRVEHQPVSFSPEESTQIADLKSSNAWIKYKNLALQFGPEWRTTVGPAFFKIATGCKRDAT